MTICLPTSTSVSESRLEKAPAGSRHLVIEGAGHAEGHAVDPAAYEAAVNVLVRDAFGATRP